MVLGAGGLAWRGIDIEGSVEVDLITEGRPVELGVQHLHRGWAEGRDDLVSWNCSDNSERAQLLKYERQLNLAQ